jgi:hypothetical protein
LESFMKERRRLVVYRFDGMWNRIFEARLFQLDRSNRQNQFRGQ